MQAIAAVEENHYTRTAAGGSFVAAALRTWGACLGAGAAQLAIQQRSELVVKKRAIGAGSRIQDAGDDDDAALVPASSGAVFAGKAPAKGTDASGEEMHGSGDGEEPDVAPPPAKTLRVDASKGEEVGTAPTTGAQHTGWTRA